VPPPASAAIAQEVSLLAHGKLSEAAGLARMLATPQAVWFTSGTPAQVERQVRVTMAEAVRRCPQATGAERFHWVNPDASYLSLRPGLRAAIAAALGGPGWHEPMLRFRWAVQAN
jgi:hypothetical protein